MRSVRFKKKYSIYSSLHKYYVSQQNSIQSRETDVRILMTLIQQAFLWLGIEHPCKKGAI